jgi:hypothetical protein
VCFAFQKYLEEVRVGNPEYLMTMLLKMVLTSPIDEVRGCSKMYSSQIALETKNFDFLQSRVFSSFADCSRPDYRYFMLCR